MNEDYFKQDAKQIVDMLFDTRALRDDLTRDDMNTLENYIHFTLQSKFNSYERLRELTEKIKQNE